MVEPAVVDDAVGVPSEPSVQFEGQAAVAWDIDTGALPASARPKAVPRPPRWAADPSVQYGRGVRKMSGTKVVKPTRRQSSNMTRERLEAFKAEQASTLSQLKELQDTGNWNRVHRLHFDWWMFPIDDGSKEKFNVTSEEDIDTLRGDPAWLEGYHEGVRLVCLSWGWDVSATRRVELFPGMGYQNWDVRLAKMCRSLYLFKEEALLKSVQNFAHQVQQSEKKGAGFFYGLVCLDELLHFELPRY